MLSTSSVHSIVSFPPCLPLTGAPPVPLCSSEPGQSLPPPQPERTAPAESEREDEAVHGWIVGAPRAAATTIAAAP